MGEVYSLWLVSYILLFGGELFIMQEDMTVANVDHWGNKMLLCNYVKFSDL